MNRFGKKKNVFKHLNKMKLSILAFLLLLLCFLYGVQSVSDTTSEKQEESLRNAVYRSIVQCYAVEGTYPSSLTYLEEHCGLTYDTDRFFIDYQPIGSNIMPDVTILVKHSQADTKGDLTNGF